MLAPIFSPRGLAHLGLALLTASAPLSTLALGINCRGSGFCTGFPINPQVSGQEAKVLADWIQGLEADGLQPVVIADDRIYKNGEHIACYQRSLICAFLQKTKGDGVSGADVKKQARFIPDHGCKVCGSVPTDYPATNNVNDGELTFNYVTQPSCNGVC